MAPVEMAVFVVLVVGGVLAIVGVAWFVQWRRNPEGFKAWMRRDPLHKGRRGTR